MDVRLATDWEAVPWTGDLRLRDEDGDGFWHAQVTLPPGRYLYRFVVDGQWSHDLDNPQEVPNGLGEVNSVLTHACPWEGGCLSDTECSESAPYCRHYACVEDPAGCLCDDGTRCARPADCGEEPPTSSCDEDIPCEDPWICEEGRCVPECTQASDCGPDELCRDFECAAQTCFFESDCHNPLTETCLEGACKPNPCDLHVFSLDPEGASFNSVHVSGSFNGWAETLVEGGLPMTYDPDRGLWYAKVPLVDGTYRYKFVINDGEQWISDAGNDQSEADGFGGRNSLFTIECDGVVCGGDFTWRDAVMYFAMVDRFADGDGVADFVPAATGGDAANGPSGQYEGGDLRGLTAKLPYLNGLGVNTVWMSAPFDNRDLAGAAMNPHQDPNMYSGYHGYWPSPANIDYSNPAHPSPVPLVEPRIGTAEDLRTFIDTAHGTSTPGGSGIKVLFDYVMNHVDLESGLYQAHPDWFVTDHTGFRLCGPENLWEDPYWGTRCAFTDYLPAFDFYNEAAVDWSVRDALWWAKEFDIDGYRLDAIKHVPLSWLTQLRGALTREISNPEGGRFYLVGETFSYDDRGLLKSFVEPDTLLDGQFDFPFKARLCESLFSFQMRLSDFAHWMDGNDSYYGPGAVMTTWIGNHDVPRAIHFAAGQIENCREGSHTGNSWTTSYPQPTEAYPYERLGLAFAVMMTNPGIPLIYYGDEIGLAGGGDPDNRRMMPWESGAINEHQEALRAVVSQLGTIRQNNRVLSRGRRMTLSADGDTWVYQMTGCDGAEDVLVAINRSDYAKTVWIPEGSYESLRTGTSSRGGSVALGARDFLLLRPNPSGSNGDL